MSIDNGIKNCFIIYSNCMCMQIIVEGVKRSNSHLNDRVKPSESTQFQIKRSKGQIKMFIINQKNEI